MRKIICFLLLCYTGLSSCNDDFKYDVGDPMGPDHWKDKFYSCSGKYQSPIDIEESLVTKVSLPALNLAGFHLPPLSAIAINNGHTAMMKFNFSTPVTLSGGPLSTPLYNFQQLHFHWGANDSAGSEDLINNHSYAMELHAVFYNVDYNESTPYTDYPSDPIAVLAFFFEVSQTDNPTYNSVVSALTYIQHPHSTVNLNFTFPLSAMLPTNLNNYFTYMGSLTTPPCREGVRWIDFKHPIQLSAQQLHKFRTLRTDNGIFITHNVRPVQPLHDRPIWYNSGEPTKIESGQTAGKGEAVNRSRINLVIIIATLSFIFIVPLSYL